MKHEKRTKPSAKAPEPAPATPAKVEGPSVEELADALRGMVTAAEEAGGRDRPDVVHAQSVLAKLEKPAA